MAVTVVTERRTAAQRGHAGGFSGGARAGGVGRGYSGAGISRGGASYGARPLLTRNLNGALRQLPRLWAKALRTAKLDWRPGLWFQHEIAK